MARTTLLVVAFLGLSACQAEESLVVSCDAGDATACYDLGLMHQAGEGGVTQDLARAVSLYHQACNGGSMMACNNLGVMYFRRYGGVEEGVGGRGFEPGARQI